MMEIEKNDDLNEWHLMGICMIPLFLGFKKRSKLYYKLVITLDILSSGYITK